MISWQIASKSHIGLYYSAVAVERKFEKNDGVSMIWPHKKAIPNGTLVKADRSEKIKERRRKYIRVNNTIPQIFHFFLCYYNISYEIKGTHNFVSFFSIEMKVRNNLGTYPEGASTSRKINHRADIWCSYSAYLGSGKRSFNCSIAPILI